MDEFEDYSEEISRRRAKLSYEKLSCCVTADHLVDEGLRDVYLELNGDSCLGRNWTKLAGKLLKPPPTTATIEHLSNSKNKAYELLKTWVSQSDLPKTFDSLIETMVECKLYSACDEFLDFLQALNLDSHEHHEDLDQIVRDEVNDLSDEASEFQQNLTSSHHINQQERLEDLDEIVSVQVDADQTSELQPNPTSRRTNEQRQYAQKPTRSKNSQSAVQRSISCPADGSRGFTKVWKKIFKRSKSSPGYLPHHTPTPPTEPTPPPPQDEIFIVSSFSDNETQGMNDLMSFVRGLKPVKRGELTVRTIHDVDQGGLVTTAWLEERVSRAKYVILCFSPHMKAIADQTSQFEHQMDYNLKFTIDFLVTGTIYYSGCRNPGGKFIPVVLDGHDRSAIIVSLRHFQNFCWPDEQERIMKYIMNLPEHPVPRQGLPKRLVPKEISC